MIMKFTVVFVLFFTACVSKPKNQEIEIIINDSVKAKGDIRIANNDTTFEGQINFYDRHSGNLVEKANYQKGLIDGERVMFYDNGIAFTTTSYSDGKLNGYSTIFNRDGQIIQKNFYYYDIPTGPIETYNFDSLVSFSFYSLEGERLIHINYDSVKVNPLTSTDLLFFLYRQIPFSQLNTNRSHITTVGTDYFLYTPAPPKLNFRYSLVLLNNNNEEKVLKSFDRKEIFSNFSLSVQPRNGEKYAIKLIAFDPSVGMDLVMLKNLEW